MKHLLLFLLVLAPLSTWAYIPRSKTILERAGKTRGEGMYAIQQEVVFKNDVETVAITEHWVILNGEKLFLDAKGSGFRFVVVYNDRNKFLIDETGTEVTKRLSEEFIEPWFHYRSTGSIGGALSRIDVIPSGSWAKDNATKDPKGNFVYTPESFVRLGRTQGVLAYAFGKATPVESAQPLPGAWFEQDRFFLRKLRLPSLAEVTADEYTEYSKGLWFPGIRNITWGENRVTIRSLKVASSPTTGDLSERLTPNYIRTQKQDLIRTQFGASNLAPQVREFYSRFR